MAYFSNGTDGMLYEEHYCYRCAHNENCTVLMLHMLWNYEQHSDATKKYALDLLIPMKEHLCSDGIKQQIADQCTMFIPVEKLNAARSQRP